MDLVRSLVSEGVFGDVELVDLQAEEQDIGVQFASSLAFLRMTVKERSGLKDLHLTVKLQAPVPGAEVKFPNELFMYEEVMPTLGVNEGSCPKLYYGCVKEQDLNRNGLVFDNLKFKGFRNSKESPFLDFKYISMAMKEIAKFHSKSYIYKQDHQEMFHEMAKKLKNYVLEDDDFETMLRTWLQRGVKAHQKANGDNALLDDFLKALKEPVALLKTLSTIASEPFAVICHGDFCNNNVMYKYDEDGSPEDIVLFDFQTSRYGSPAAELSFYLYMHTTSDIRDKHWEEFLKIYWDTLKGNVPDHVEIPSFEEFLKHFASRAVYGYIISSFFNIIVQDPTKMFWDPINTLEERVHICNTLGGQAYDRTLADMVSHLYENKYIHAFLDFMNSNTEF